MSYIQLSEANCRNCLRCVRVCPTKAMTYQNHQPTIIEEECILCGKCYAICPHSAKKVHSDIEAVRQWIREGQPLALSIAPSFASVWPDYPQLKRQLQALGFAVVEETAVGARLVSEAYMRLIEQRQMKNILSTCCPAVVTYVEKNFPDLIDQLAPVVSPMIAHGFDLKVRYPGYKTVFLSPCIAKQKEAADPRFAGAIDAVLTMPDLSAWLKDIPVQEMSEAVPWENLQASTVRMYPTPGGVIRTLSSSDEVYERVSAEGMERVKDALNSIAQGHMEGYFFELSACEQSCLGGPLLCHVDHSEWKARSAIRRNMDPQDQVRQAQLPSRLRADWQADPIQRSVHTEEEIKDMLFLMGKTTKEKELDCGACGYESCRAKAIAVLEGNATKIMELVNEDINRIEAKTVFEAARLGDRLAIQITERAMQYIGIGLANYINLLDPDLIILFGGLTNAGDIFLKKVKEVLRERQMKFAGRQVKLVISQMGENGTAVGSASLVLKKFIKYGN